MRDGRGGGGGSTCDFGTSMDQEQSPNVPWIFFFQSFKINISFFFQLPRPTPPAGVTTGVHLPPSDPTAASSSVAPTNITHQCLIMSKHLNHVAFNSITVSVVQTLTPPTGGAAGLKSTARRHRGSTVSPTNIHFHHQPLVIKPEKTPGVQHSAPVDAEVRHSPTPCLFQTKCYSCSNDVLLQRS